MADNLNYFEIERGLSIDANAQVITVGGAPGVSGDSTTVPQGSIALDYTNGDLYYKNAAGSGTDKWKKVANTEDALSEISWREPVLATDDTTNTIGTGIGATDTIDGVTINDGDRVLFRNAALENIYIFDSGTSGGTYVEDSNPETAGDRVYVEDGSVGNAGSVFTYNAAGSWVLSEKATDEKELSYIRQYVGKTVLGDLSATEPAYSSTTQVANLDPLVTAIGKLDAAIGTDLTAGNIVTAGQNANPAIQALDDALGDIGTQITTSVIAGQTNAVIDTVPVAEAAVVEWLVYFRNGTNVRSYFVTATHDGDDTPTEASNTDRAVRTRLLIGTLATSVGVTLSGGGGGENINLVVTNTPAIDVKILRRTVQF